MRNKQVFAVMYRHQGDIWRDWGGRDTWMAQNEKVEHLQVQHRGVEFWVLHQKLIGKYANTAKAATA